MVSIGIPWHLAPAARRVVTFNSATHAPRMTDFIRGQIIFRRAVGSATPDYSQPQHARFESRHPFVYDIGLAMIECDPDTFADEQLLDLSLSGGPDSRRLSIGTRGEPMDPDTKIDKLDGLLTRMQIKPPFLGALLCCGGMVLRKTRFPASPGRIVMAGAALMRSPIEVVPEREMFTLMGTPSRLTMGSPEEVPAAFPMGSALCQTFGAPIWGFGEKRAFYSTLHLDCIDAGKEYVPLTSKEEPTDADRVRIAELERTGLVDAFRWNKNDLLFNEFKRRAIADGIALPLDSYPTAAELKAHSASVSDLVRELADIFEEESRPRYA
jgi:hypothetical protein